MKSRLPCLKHKFSKIEKYIDDKQELKILDIGAGNHSASITKKRYPFCIYHGLDLDKNYHNDENDFQCMDYFYEMDLTKYKRLIFLMPTKIIYEKLKYGYIKGSCFWDILGFAEYCIFLKSCVS